MDSLNIFIQIVTWNNASTIVPCLSSVLAQEGFVPAGNLHVTVYDNASTDDSCSLIEQSFGDSVTLIRNSSNLGFAGGHNLGFLHALQAGADYVLILNPDLALARDALEHLLEPLQLDSRAGASCPKLLRADHQLRPLLPPLIDSSGMYITPEVRHLDRGSGEPDSGQYELPQYVFGASGACVLFSRDCLLDISLPHCSEENLPRLSALPVFDEAFFAYREDADLAWRMQWLGWKTRYEPRAVGFHVRTVVPERRSSLPETVNSWSVRNRFLMQVNNLSLRAHGGLLVFAVLRNVLVVCAVLLRERSSLIGLQEAWSLLPRAFRRRAELFRRRRESPLAIRRWFSWKPHAEPAVALPPVPAEIKGVTAVIISFCTGKLAAECARNLLQSSSACAYRLNVRILDNTPAGSPGAVTGPVPDAVTVFRHPENLGFAGAVNATLSSSDDELICILNPDVSLERGLLDELVQMMATFSDLGMLAPVLCGPDRQPQLGFTVRRFPKFSDLLAELFLLHRILPANPWTRNYRMEDDSFFKAFLAGTEAQTERPYDSTDLPRLVEQPAGACLLIRASVARSITGFDESFYPAWFEDVDFAKRLFDAGVPVAMHGSVRATHIGGVTKDLLPESTFHGYWYRNLSRYWKKHGTAVQVSILRGALPLSLVLRGMVFLFLALFSHVRNQPERRDRFRGLSGVLFRLSAELIRSELSGKERRRP